MRSRAVELPSDVLTAIFSIDLEAIRSPVARQARKSALQLVSKLWAAAIALAGAKEGDAIVTSSEAIDRLHKVLTGEDERARRAQSGITQLLVDVTSWSSKYAKDKRKLDDIVQLLPRLTTLAVNHGIRFKSDGSTFKDDATIDESMLAVIERGGELVNIDLPRLELQSVENPQCPSEATLSQLPRIHAMARRRGG